MFYSRCLMWPVFVVRDLSTWPLTWRWNTPLTSTLFNFRRESHGRNLDPEGYSMSILTRQLLSLGEWNILILIYGIKINSLDNCRDSSEVSRELSGEERREFSKRFLIDGGSIQGRKMETGLCINLARTPPTWTAKLQINRPSFKNQSNLTLHFNWTNWINKCN